MYSQKEILTKALKNNYAVGAFNFASLDQLEAILQSAKENHSPVILAVSEGAIAFFGDEIFKGILEKINNSGVLVSLHLDHGKSFESCKHAIDLGFNSVMIDGSTLPYEQNIAITEQVCKYAHQFNVQVEGELGTLGNTDDDLTKKCSMYTNPEKVKDFVAKTGVDSLAIAIGTSHGAYKYKYSGDLRYDILDQVQKLCPDLPLVLHGASLVEKNAVDRFNKSGGYIENSSGNEGKLKNIYKTNICKINIDTDIKITYLTAVREFLNKNKDCIDMRKVSVYAVEEMKKTITDRILNLLKSNNKI